MSENNKDQQSADTKPKIERWSYTEYEILSFQLTTEFVAVFAQEAEDGLCDLFSYPITAIGLAKATTRFVEGVKGRGSNDYREPEINNDLVGLRLEEGFWQIANGDHNFAGLAGVHDDISKAWGSLNMRDYKLRQKYIVKSATAETSQHEQ